MCRNLEIIVAAVPSMEQLKIAKEPHPHGVWGERASEIAVPARRCRDPARFARGVLPRTCFEAAITLIFVRREALCKHERSNGFFATAVLFMIVDVLILKSISGGSSGR
jgi:hypothetical protein